MKLYEFETLNDFGYAKDPLSVYNIVMAQISKLDHYTVSNGRADMTKRRFKSYRAWQSDLNRDGEIYYEVYGGKPGERESFLGIIKITEFVTVD